jgi:histidinol-phosphatase
MLREPSEQPPAATPEGLDSEWRRLVEIAHLAGRRAGEVLMRHFRSPDLAVERKADGSPVTRADRQAEEVIRDVLRRAEPGLGFYGEETGADGPQGERWIVDPLDGTASYVRGIPWFGVLIALEIGGEFRLGLVHAPTGDLGVPEDAGAEAAAAGGTTWWAVRGHGAWAVAGAGPALSPLRRLWARSTGGVEQALVAHGDLPLFHQEGLWEPLQRIADRAGRTEQITDWRGHVLVAEGSWDAMVDPQVRLYDVAAVKVLIEEAGGVFLIRDDAPLDEAFRGPVLSAAPGVATELSAMLSF